METIEKIRLQDEIELGKKIFKNLKKGDKVRIKDNIEEGYIDIEGVLYVHRRMKDFAGKIVTVDCVKNDCHCQGINIKEDTKSTKWIWYPSLIEVLPKNKASVSNFKYYKTYQKFIETDNDGNILKAGGFNLPERNSKVIHSGNATIVILDDGSKGIAKCDPDDKYDKTKGIKIAYNRAKIKSLTKEIKKLYND